MAILDVLGLDGVLTKNEKIVAQADIHWGVYWKSIFILVMGLILSIFVIQLGVILLVVGALLLIRAHLHRLALMFVITNKRVLMRYGLLQVDVVDMRFKHIESIELERMPPGLIMGYATLQIMGTGQRIVRVPYVANGREIRKVYSEITLEDD